MYPKRGTGLQIGPSSIRGCSRLIFGSVEDICRDTVKIKYCDVYCGGAMEGRGASVVSFGLGLLYFTFLYEPDTNA